MPTVHTRYVTYTRAGGRRLHVGSAERDITSPLATSTPPGGVYAAWAPPEISWSDDAGGHTARFAFWSVVSAADGSSVETSPHVSVTVGDADVQAVAWYLPGGGGGGGVAGLYVDAFDVDAGRFFDEDFVTVTSDPSLSAAANASGFVPTASGVDLDAVGAIESVPFLDWIELVAPTPRVLGDERLHADAGETAVAFACYSTPDRSGRVKWRRPAEGTWVSWGVMVDAGGPTGRGPVPPWTPFVSRLTVGLALAEAAELVEPDLRADVSRLAAAQVEQASRRIAAQMRKDAGRG